MSAGLDSRAAWLEQNYEKLAVVGVLVGLVISAIVLVVRIHTGHRLLAVSDRGVPADRQAGVQPADLGPIEGALARLGEPPSGGGGEARMWHSALRVHCVNCMRPIAFDATRCPFCRTEQPEAVVIDPERHSSAGDGIPDRWKEQFDLDPMDPYLHLRDLDGDGFTLLEEYRANTDPTDPESFPPPVMKLRLEEVRSLPFMLRFQAVQELVEGEFRFQLNMRTLERTYFARLGDTVEGHLVERYDPEERTVFLKRGDRTIPLRRGEVQEEIERVLVMRSLLDNSRFPTRVEQSFDMRGITYLVVERLPDGVRVRDLSEEGRTYFVGRLTEDERRALERRPGDMGMDPDAFIDEDPEGMMPPLPGRPGTRPAPPRGGRQGW